MADVRPAPLPPPDPLSTDGLVWPRDFDARYGDGLRLGVSLGGGGVFFVAWQVAYLHELAGRGIDLAGADRVVGTSAGAVVAAVLEARRIRRLHAELSVVARLPKLLGAIAPVGNLAPSQLRAAELFRSAADAEPTTVRAIGHAALAAQAPASSVMPRKLALILAFRRWPSAALHITCVDTYSGERCIVTGAAGVGIARAVAASSAVPGLFAPQPIGDRRCMDGGVSGSGTHLDLLAGAERVVVLSLTDGRGLEQGMLTSAPGSTEKESAALEASGSRVFYRVPASVDPKALMDPAAVPDAVEMGRRQAAADAGELSAFIA
ncbi:MAG: patatin-like phospholipase family protein [Acidimicrobiia bacterium]|nr:patatin-like phospholipase family protein [Acidimicrobiia bacterium]